MIKRSLIPAVNLGLISRDLEEESEGEEKGKRKKKKERKFY